MRLFKTFISVLILIIILSLFCFSVLSEPAVMVSDYEIYPSILMPGDKAVLSTTITNEETTSTTVTTNTLTGTYSESVVETEVNGAVLKKVWIPDIYDSAGNYLRGGSSYLDIGLLSAGKSIDLDFLVTAHENLTEGIYFPDLKINLESDSHQDVIYPFKIKVSNNTVDLIKKDVPNQVSQSGSTDIVLSVVNNRENSVEAVQVFADDIEEIDFIPNSVFVGSLDSYSSEDVSFSIVPKEVGNYNISFKVNFKNGDNLHNSTIYIPIEVVENYDVAPVIYSFPEYISKGNTADIRLEVYNAKTEEITGVIVKPVTNVKISPSEYFIGSMDSDDVFSASFDVDTSSLDVGDSYSIDFKVLFKQGDNYYETNSVSSTFIISEPIVRQSSNLTLYLIIIFITLIVVYLLIRFFKKRRISK